MLYSPGNSNFARKVICIFFYFWCWTHVVCFYFRLVIQLIHWCWCFVQILQLKNHFLSKLVNRHAALIYTSNFKFVLSSYDLDFLFCALYFFICFSDYQKWNMGSINNFVSDYLHLYILVFMIGIQMYAFLRYRISFLVKGNGNHFFIIMKEAIYIQNF